MSLTKEDKKAVREIVNESINKALEKFAIITANSFAGLRTEMHEGFAAVNTRIDEVNDSLTERIDKLADSHSEQIDKLRDDVRIVKTALGFR